MSRIESFDAFWPYYISEHRDPTSRRLHFLGTSLFFGAVVVSLVRDPVYFPLALVGMLAIATDAVMRVEREKRSIPHVLGMVLLPSLASPAVFPAGVVGAYGCAWIGHFRFEGNRPATFEYPVWSLASDLRMWSHMARGRLWSGDPVAELGLEGPPDAKG